MPTPPPRRAALARVEPSSIRPSLTSEERELLAEALRRGEDLRSEVESKVLGYGRWLLGAVFHDDARAALDAKAQNPVFRELLRRAGGPTLRVNRKLLYVALRIAAHDKRIGDQSWRGLDAGRKELLLPLGDDVRLREGAQHVAKFNLTHADTRAYVAEALKSQGRARQVRVSAPRLVSRFKTLRTSIDKAAVLRKVSELRESLAPAEREEMVAEVEKLRAALAEVVKAVRGKR